MNKLLIIAFVILSFGCNQNKPFTGKWGYVNSENDYAEMWFNDNQVMMIDASFYQVQLYDYSYDNDSIYMIRENAKLFAVKYEFESNEKLNLGNQYQVSSLKKIDDETKSVFKYSDEFVESVRAEFVERAESQ